MVGRRAPTHSTQHAQHPAHQQQPPTLTGVAELVLADERAVALRAGVQHGVLVLLLCCGVVWLLVFFWRWRLFCVCAVPKQYDNPTHSPSHPHTHTALSDARTMSVQVSTSRCQCPSVVSGATTRKGPAALAYCRSHASTAMLCAVLPRPIFVFWVFFLWWCFWGVCVVGGALRWWSSPPPQNRHKNPLQKQQTRQTKINAPRRRGCSCAAATRRRRRRRESCWPSTQATRPGRGAARGRCRSWARSAHRRGAARGGRRGAGARRARRQRRRSARSVPFLGCLCCFFGRVFGGIGVCFV